MAGTGEGRPRSAKRNPSDDTGASFASTPQIRARMQAQRVRDTKPELAVRSLLHASGLRFRVDRAPLPGVRRRADIVFTKQKIAVFIDGCFWHSCPDHGNLPKTNSDFWREKLETNVRRDVDTDTALLHAGWAAMRFWEHEQPDEVANAIEKAVRGAQ